MAKIQIAKIQSKIQDIINDLIHRKKTDSAKEYNNYIDALLFLFRSLLDDEGVLLEMSDNNHAVYQLDEIINRLSFAHLPKKTLNGFLLSISALNLPQEIINAINLCLVAKNKYYTIDQQKGGKRYLNFNDFIREKNKEINTKTIPTLRNRFTNVGSPTIYPATSLVDKNYNNLENKVRSLDNKLKKLLADDGKEKKEIYDQASKRSSEILAKLQQEISDLQASTKQNVTDKIEQIKTDLETSKKELTGLVGDLEKYQRLINYKSEEEVTKHYSEKATSEMWTYWVATIISILIIMGSLYLAWSGLDGYFKTYVQETDSAKLKALAQTAEYAKIYLGFRLVLSFLLFSTVIYTSRIAYRAYIHWRHSESMKLKLSSLRPFINQLEPDDRKQIHKDLVPDYFGKDAGMIDVAGEKFKDFPTNVSAVVMKAMDHANGALGNSKKDEPAKDDKSSAEKDKKEEA